VRPAAASSFDVATWLLNRARHERQPMPSPRLQRLLYLAQAHFAGATDGQRLMPSVFIVTKRGPLEPNLIRVHDLGAAIIEVESLRQPVVEFLDGIWMAFGGLPQEQLNAMVMDSSPVKAALKAGIGSVISERAMADSHGEKRVGAASVVPGSGLRRGRSKVPRYHRGKPVSRWVPGQKPGKD
jgi:uncharacterized phage-associated protein